MRLEIKCQSGLTICHEFGIGMEFGLQCGRRKLNVNYII